MRLLESTDHTVWAACERCGNAFPGGTQRCGRCGNTPTHLHGLTRLAGLLNGSRGTPHLKRSRGTYPGLAETALRFNQERRRRATGMALACAVCAVALVVYVFIKPHVSRIDSDSRAVGAHTLATGAVTLSEPASAPETTTLPGPLPQSDGAQHADSKSQAQGNAQTLKADADDFYRALQRRNLAAAHRRLADMSENSAGSSQWEQMHADLASREHLRDVLVRRAWRCRAMGDWQCVSENARQASAIDTSSEQAKRLVSQAEREASNVPAE